MSMDPQYEEDVVRAVETPAEALPGRESDEVWFYLRSDVPAAALSPALT